ncbi:unnamed protein product, partial [Protopolystoma xenopodis]
MLPIGGRGGQGYSLFSESSAYLDQRVGLSAAAAEALEELKNNFARMPYYNGWDASLDNSIDLEPSAGTVSNASIELGPEEEFAYYRCPPGFDRVKFTFMRRLLGDEVDSEGGWITLDFDSSKRQFEQPRTQQFCWRSRLRLEDMRGYESNVTKAHVPSASAADQSTPKFNDTFASNVATNITNTTVATSLPSSTVTGADSLTRGSTYLSRVDDMLRLLNLERFERKHKKLPKTTRGQQHEHSNSHASAEHEEKIPVESENSKKSKEMEHTEEMEDPDEERSGQHDWPRGDYCVFTLRSYCPPEM